MLNPRLTVKDLNNIKGALRRAFARSELRNKIVNKNVIEHCDPQRTKVKTWCWCSKCGVLDARSYMQVDHIKPIVPTDKSYIEMMTDGSANIADLVDLMWCDENNLQCICIPCHKIKGNEEREVRKNNRKASKNGRRKVDSKAD